MFPPGALQFSLACASGGISYLAALEEAEAAPNGNFACADGTKPKFTWKSADDIVLDGQRMSKPNKYNEACG